jgi:DNA-binding NarL/FixJ family response regulator
LRVRKVLIVEDDYVVAAHLAAAIEDDGFKVVGPVGTARSAICRIDEEALDGALLDIGLREGSAVDVARALRAHGVSFVIVSGYSRDTLPTELKDAPYVGKPMGQSELIQTARHTFKVSPQY